MEKIFSLVIILVIIVSSSTALSQEIKHQRSSKNMLLSDLDITIHSGFAGIVVKIRNNGPDVFSQDAKISITGTKGLGNEIKILLLIPEIQSNEVISLKTRDVLFLFGLTLVHLDIRLYLDEDDQFDARVSRAGLLMGPFLIIKPAELL